MAIQQGAQDAIRAFSESTFSPLPSPQSNITFLSAEEGLRHVREAAPFYGFTVSMFRSQSTVISLGCSSGNLCTWTMDLTLVEEKQPNGVGRSVWRCTKMTPHAAHHQVRSEEEAKNVHYGFTQRSAQAQVMQAQPQNQNQVGPAQLQPPLPPRAPNNAQPHVMGAPPVKHHQELIPQLGPPPGYYALQQAQLQAQPPQPQVAPPPAVGPPPKALIISGLSKISLQNMLTRANPILGTPSCVAKFSKLGNNEHLLVNLLGYDTRMLEAMAGLVGLDEKEKVAFLGYFHFSEEVKGWKKILGEKV